MAFIKCIKILIYILAKQKEDRFISVLRNIRKKHKSKYFISKKEGVDKQMKFYIGTSFKNVDLMNKVADKLKQHGWTHTYNWAEEATGEETIEDLIKFSVLERKAIEESDAVIILLPAGRGTHVELGMALALNKQVYLWQESGKEFEPEDTVNFYYAPGIIRVVGAIEDAMDKIIKSQESYAKQKKRKKSSQI